jgi:hypothetical protein
MRAVLDRARVLGAEGVWLAVWERNARAQVFYAKHGFRRVGRQAFQFGSDTQSRRPRPAPVLRAELAIVAGGGATRLGGGKPLLRVVALTVLERLLALGTLDEVLLVSADPRLPDSGVAGGRCFPGGALGRRRRRWPGERALGARGCR